MEKGKKWEKMKDFLYKITSTAEVSHDHVEDYFKEKGMVNNTLVWLTERGWRPEDCPGEKKRGVKNLSSMK